MEDNIKPFYNTSELYLGFLQDRSSEDFKNVIDVINQYIPKKSHLLEFGCGIGSLASMVSNGDYDVTGVDISEKFIRYAQDNQTDHFETLRFRTVDFGSLPFPDGSFDCIFSCAVLEHCYNVKNILEDFHRLLKPGGILIVNTPNMISPFTRLSMIASKLSGKRKKYHLYGSPSFFLKSLGLNFRKAFAKEPVFSYVTPDYSNISEGDEDVSYLSNQFDYLSFLRPLHYNILEISRGTSSIGKVISRLFPRLAGEVLIVAKKPG